MKGITLTLILISLSLQAESFKEIELSDAVVSKVTAIFNGNSFRANITGYPSLIGKRMSIKIKGIDIPKMRSKCKQEKKLAKKAKGVTVKLLRGAKVIELHKIKRAKHFKLVADVYADGVSVGATLAAVGLAVKYDGGTKTKDWCK